MSTRARIAVLAAVVVIAVAGFVIAAGSGDDEVKRPSATTATGSTTTDTAPSETETTTTTAKPAGPPVHRIRVVGGKPQGGVQKIDVTKGDTIRIAVTSDVADEIHIHGYDLMKDVDAGGTARFRFKATIDGGFEIELENRKEQIASLTVEP
jgi:FtsP/CotA-like multicopper oxidase with cupredoxin domain